MQNGAQWYRIWRYAADCWKPIPAWKGGLNLSNEELATTFTEWNEGELSSYLIDITKEYLHQKDEEGKYLVDGSRRSGEQRHR